MGSHGTSKGVRTLDPVDKPTVLRADHDALVLLRESLLAIASLAHQAAEFVHKFQIARTSFGQYPGIALFTSCRGSKRETNCHEGVHQFNARSCLY